MIKFIQTRILIALVFIFLAGFLYPHIYLFYKNRIKEKEVMLAKVDGLFITKEEFAKEIEDIGTNNKEVLDYYNQHKDEFIRKPQRRIYHILFETKQEAERFINRLKQARKNGDYGTKYYREKLLIENYWI